nr:unnamed protein product [Callosobruchus analis]
MVRAWYMDEDKSDQRNEHHKNPPEFVDIGDLKKLTGCEYFKINYNGEIIHEEEKS